MKVVIKNIKIIFTVIILIITVILILSYLRYIDLIQNSDILSFIGGIIGSLIGVIGALYVVYKGEKIKEERNINNLIEMFKHTYIWILPRYYISNGYYSNVLSDPTVPLIYDSNWKSYIIDIKNSHHKKFLLNWFYSIDSLDEKHKFISKVNRLQIIEAKKIIEFYGFYDDEVKEIEDVLKLQENKKLRKKIIENVENLKDIHEAKEEYNKSLFEEYNKELNEESEIEDVEYMSEEQIIDSLIYDDIKKFESQIRKKENIYCFK